MMYVPRPITETLLDWESTVRKLKETIYGADVLDDEGNVVAPTPTQEAETTDAANGQENDTQNTEAATDDGDQITMEAEIGAGHLPHRSCVKRADGQVGDSLQNNSQKKSGCGGEQYRNTSGGWTEKTIAQSVHRSGLCPESSTGAGSTK